VEVPDGMLDAVVAELLAAHGRRWRQEYAEHPERLPRAVEDLLVAVGLLRRRASGLWLTAVAARYAPDVVVHDAALALDPTEAR
jgi:hypothetical protein